jgi:hypothetical protein
MASLTQMPICPSGTGSASPTSAVPRPMPSPSRLIRATAGRAGSSSAARSAAWPALHAGQPGHLACTSSGGKYTVSAGAGAHGRAHVQIRRQHHVQPVRHRVAKAGHHHREGHRQAQRGDDAADGHRGTARAHRRARSTASIGSSRRDTHGASRLYSQADQPGQGRDAAHQQQPDRHIGGQRNARHRRGLCQQHAGSAISSRGTARCCPVCGSAAPRPLSVCAGGRFCAARAGHQPPTPAQPATPSRP